ncbi:hypothetical protein DRP04_01755 [Archaeoglobales archaeon]|nr:MAG: hypothetical protein DRP04_01755 [Archaeoglobales archaeon]
MVETKIDEEKISRFLLQKLKERKWVHGNSVGTPMQLLSLIIEVERNRADEIIDELQKLGITIDRSLISWGTYIPVKAPVRLIPEIQKIPGVVKVWYDTPRYITSTSQTSPTSPTSLPAQPPAIQDPLLGKIELSPVEIPAKPLEVPIRIITGWISAIISGLGFNPLRIHNPNVEILPNSVAAEIAEVPDLREVEVKVAVLDTGAPLPAHPHWRKSIKAVSFTGEAPWDGNGHGSYCTCQAFGKQFATRFGIVRGIVDARNAMHGKVLTNAGFGSTKFVLKGMEWAYNSGAKVVSMSLGGPLQDGLQDPEVRVVEATRDEIIWVIAAGNEGPDEWTIGSPAAAPSALTVASYSPLYGDVAVFSSRGPQASWFKEHKDEYEEGLKKYGDDFKKPDVMASGGGPVKEGQKPDLLYGATQGWFDGVYDLTVEGFEAFRGTSMATPVAAGLVALLLEERKIKTAGDVKKVMAKVAEEEGREKDIARGYGLIKYTYF